MAVQTRHVKAVPKAHNTSVLCRDSPYDRGRWRCSLRHELVPIFAATSSGYTVVHEEHLSFTHELATDCGGGNLGCRFGGPTNVNTGGVLRRGGKGRGLEYRLATFQGNAESGTLMASTSTFVRICLSFSFVLH